MGPITLFDKSFLQSLSLDESVWFDHFFLTNVCPLFFVETLADLEKSVDEGRTPEQEVGIIADKFPQMHGTPSAYHATLCVNELLGYPVASFSSKFGQIPVAGGHLVKSDGRSAAVIEKSPESQAFTRWQNREFLETEREFAQDWRSNLAALDLHQAGEFFRRLGIDARSCKTLADAAGLAKSVVYGTPGAIGMLKLAFWMLNIPADIRPIVEKRWRRAGRPSLNEFAPYAAYVLVVEIFFQMALASGLIHSGRNSNQVDIGYLFYLPFCMMFVSNDKLHRRCAPLFLRDNQEFVWGFDLKSGLTQVNLHYKDQPASITEKGVITFTDPPPELPNNIVLDLWGRFVPKALVENIEEPETDHESPSAETISKFADAPALLPREVDFDPGNPDGILLKRSISRKKGSWYQIPKSHQSQ